MQDYYEELWERLPPDLSPPHFELRRRFLRSGVNPGDRALDLGCGEGDFTAELAAADAQPIGAEVAEAALTRARARYPRLAFKRVRIEGPLPFEDHAFDVVWSSEVIEHVADTARWLSEVRRVLAPSGRLLLTTPSHGRARLAVHGIERFSEPVGEHLHLYSKRSLHDLLTDFGFDRVFIRTAGGAPLLRRLLLARAVR